VLVGVRERVRGVWNGRGFDNGMNSWDELGEHMWEYSSTDRFR